MHVQTGYQFAWKGKPEFVEDEPQGFVAILHGQIIAERTGARLTLNHNGFITPSTVRGINGALEDGGVSGIRAVLTPGGILVSNSRTGESALNPTLIITLDKGNNP